MKTSTISCASFLLLALAATAGPAAIPEGRAWGDIHVQTMDGATFDFQSAGEFIASRSPAGDFEIQLRLEQAGFPGHVSIATAVAAQVDSTRISVALGRESLLFLEGEPAALQEGFVDLPGGGRVERSGRGFEIYWADGSNLSLTVRKRYLDVFLRPAETRRGSLHGLFGNFNGNPADDFEAAVADLGSRTSSRLHPALADLARTLLTEEDNDQFVTQEASLFEYEPGQTTWTFRHPKPPREATPEALSSTWRRRAQAVCREAGISDPDLLKSCIVDVGYTRDESFAESAAAVQARDDTNWDAELAAAEDAGF